MDPPPDWLDNSAWFDDKVLVDLQNFEETKTKGIADRGYADAMASCLRQLGLPSHYQLHFGWVMGAIEMEVSEEALKEDIQILGNWDPKQQEKAYSSKLPMRAMFTKGGYSSKHGGVYYNERTISEPVQELMDLFWPFVTAGLEQTVASFNTRDPKKTAHAYLLFLNNLKRVILQDATYMLLKYPERASYAVFQLPLFLHPLFLEFKEQMRRDIAALTSPTEVNLNHALPGVVEHLNAGKSAINNCHQTVSLVRSELNSGIHAVRNDIAQLHYAITGKMTAVGKALINTGNALISPDSREGTDASDDPATVSEGGDGNSPTPTQQHDIPAPFEGYDYRPN